MQPHPWNTRFRWIDHTGPFRRITAEQARAFDTDGFFVLPGAVDAATVELRQRLFQDYGFALFVDIDAIDKTEVHHVDAQLGVHHTAHGLHHVIGRTRGQGLSHLRLLDLCCLCRSPHWLERGRLRMPSSPAAHTSHEPGTARRP